MLQQTRQGFSIVPKPLTEGVGTVALVDLTPFVVFLLVGVVAGRFLSGAVAWLLALSPPVAHLGLGVLTGLGMPLAITPVLFRVSLCFGTRDQ